jgi:hypothetical protein
MTPADVQALAAAADLPLPADRAALVAEQLGGWLAAANELSAKMSAPEFAAVTPATVFTHPDAPANEA